LTATLHRVFNTGTEVFKVIIVFVSAELEGCVKLVHFWFHYCKQCFWVES